MVDFFDNYSNDILIDWLFYDMLMKYYNGDIGECNYNFYII